MSAISSNSPHPITGTKPGPKGGGARLLLLATALLSNGGRGLQEATGNPTAQHFFPNQTAVFVCDDILQATEKSRQIGQSWAFAADSLARAIVEPATANVHISIDKWESEAKHEYVERTLEAFPRNIRAKIGLPENSKNHMVIEMGRGHHSSIDFLAQRPARGLERGGIYLHEMAYMPKIRAIIKAGIFATTHGGFIKGCSSHEGSDSVFNDIVTNKEDEDTGEQEYENWTVGRFPWWTCPILCTDIEAAMREAPSLETEERVAKFGTETLKKLRKSSSYDDFREEMECEVIDARYSYFPTELINKCQIDKIGPEDFYFDKLELTARDFDAVHQAEALIYKLGQKIQQGLMPGRWFWAMDIGVKHDPDAICIGQTLDVDKNVVALRAVITMEGMDFPKKERIITYLIKNLPVERGFIDATGPGTQLGQWGLREFGQKAMPFVFSQQSKSEIVNDLKIRMERGIGDKLRCLMIPQWGKLQRQIHSIRKTITAGGKPVYDSAREDKTHADIFWALAMMNALAGSPNLNNAFVPPLIQRPDSTSGNPFDRGRLGGFSSGGLWLPRGR